MYSVEISKILQKPSLYSSLLGQKDILCICYIAFFKYFSYHIENNILIINIYLEKKNAN